MSTSNKAAIEKRLSKFLRQSGLAPTTQALYRVYTQAFFDWCYQNGQDPEQADKWMLNDWFTDHQNWAAATKHTAIGAIKSFFRYAFGDDHPVLQMKSKRQNPGPQRCLDEGELLAMLNACDTSTIQGIRDLAILTLLADTGLRVSEASNILLNRVSTTKNELTVQIKGGEWARALFFDYTRSCLDRWLAVRSMVAAEGTHLFTSLRGKNPGKKLGAFGIRYVVKKLAKRAGIDKTTPHALRRTFATISIKNGAPTRVVQVAGRWKTIEMVEHYSRSLMADAIRPYSVINNLMGVGQMTKPETRPAPLSSNTQIDQGQERAVWAEMLETIASLEPNENGLTYSIQIDQDQDAQTREILAEMLETIVNLEPNENGLTYGLFLERVMG